MRGNLNYSGLILELVLNFRFLKGWISQKHVEHHRFPDRHDSGGGFPGRVSLFLHSQTLKADSEHIQKEFRKEHDSEIPAETLQDREKQQERSGAVTL